MHPDTTVLCAPTELDIDLDVDPQRALVRLSGELDAVTAPALAAALDRLHAEGPRRITVDVAGLRFLGCAGLREFVRASDAMREFGGRLVLTELSPHLRRLLELTGQTGSLTEPAPPAAAAEGG
jgi:anti-anti-sigma factor